MDYSVDNICAHINVDRTTSQHTGCPICANRVIIPEENSLAALVPQIAAEWNYERNGDLLPENLSAGNNRTVWWRCSLGHEWQAAINTRTSKNSGCPVCMNRKVLPGFNDLATTHPPIAAQWHPTLNGKYTPQMFTYGSMRKVWWICADGHVWKAPISRRAGTQKSGCQIYSGRIRMARKKSIWKTSVLILSAYPGKLISLIFEIMGKIWISIT